MWSKVLKFATNFLYWFLGFSMMVLGAEFLMMWLKEDGFSIIGFVLGFMGYLILRPAAEYWKNQLLNVWKSEE